MLLDKIMMTGGIAGVIVCTVILCMLPRIFEKRRKKILDEIKEEF